jgi:alpha-L-rhamnosidase
MNPSSKLAKVSEQRSPHPGAWQRIVTATCLLLMPIPSALSQQRSTAGVENTAKIYQNFMMPPSDARPMVRWWWFGVAVQKTEILHELEQMKADGIGGVELAFVYPQVLDDPARELENLPFLSPAMLNDVTYAETEGRKLGLRVDLTLCSGWPYGGPSTTLTEAAGRLQTVQVLLGPGQTTVSSPRLAEGDSIVSVQIAKGVPGNWDATSARPVNLTQDTTTFAPGTDSRTVLFFIAGHSRQQVKRSAVGAEGYVLDPFSHEAVSSYLRSVGAPLVNAFGNTPPFAIFSDSLEAYGADWTPSLPAEFLRRRGYDLLPHLAELVSGGSVAADTIRHDYGKTLTELVDENYLTQITDWAVAHHTRFRSQTYGTPAVSFSSQDRVTLAEGEGSQWRAFSTLRWATSANHVFGHNITSGETFTWLHSPVFRATPLDMKAEADIDLIMGENQIIFHGWPYSPPQVDEPGWSLYAAAALNDHNPWHPVMPYVTKYLTRLSYLMRQGEPANQVALLLPNDDAWASFSPGSVSVTDRMKKLVPPNLIDVVLSSGYNLDFIDADAIDHRGIHSRILILPATERIPKKTLEKIVDFVNDGGKVIAVGRIPFMTPEGQPMNIPMDCGHRGDKQSATACHPLFDAAAHTFVADPLQLGDALHKMLQPDFELIDTDTANRSQLGFIHRKLSFADIYFVVNTSNHEINATVNFATDFKFAEQWNPDTTIATSASARAHPLHLAPYESSVFVFCDAQSTSKPSYSLSSSRQLADLSKNWSIKFVSTHKSYDESALTDWIANPSTLHYSGEAVYSRDFIDSEFPRQGSVILSIDGGKLVSNSLNSEAQTESIGPHGLPNPLVTRTGPGMRAYYDPPIREAALVSINGQVAGALWHPPYVVDVTKYLKPGRNQIKIRVYNTALNAWSSLPSHNYEPLIAKYGDRFQMQDLDQVKPLSSGLLGSVRLLSVEGR